MRNLVREQAACIASGAIHDFLRSCSPFPPRFDPELAIVLGTGWGNTLVWERVVAQIPLAELPGFGGLSSLDGHDRVLVCGTIAGRDVMALRGRIHIYEQPCSQDHLNMVRLQVEMLLKFGAKKIILTNAVGSLRDDIVPGDIVFVNGFVTLFAPEMPLWESEFCSPEDALSDTMRQVAVTAAFEDVDLDVGGFGVHRGNGETAALVGPYAMVRGPFFEGRKYDKKILASLGAATVGMSILPEVCIASLYDIPVLALSFVSNDDKEVHTHEGNKRRALEKKELLGRLLSSIIRRI